MILSILFSHRCAVKFWKIDAMPQGRKKVPFSTKQKKKQLQHRREQKQGENKSYGRQALAYSNLLKDATQEKESTDFSKAVVNSGSSSRFYIIFSHVIFPSFLKLSYSLFLFPDINWNFMLHRKKPTMKPQAIQFHFCLRYMLIYHFIPIVHRIVLEVRFVSINFQFIACIGTWIFGGNCGRSRNACQTTVELQHE